MSSVEIILAGSLLTTVTASLGYCWWHFRNYRSQPVIEQDP